jgi:hypothetical protein
MLIRASAKFRQQYHCVVEDRDPPVRPFPQTWNVDLLSNGRSQLVVLASEEYSLFSVLIPIGRARNVNAFLNAFRERLLQLFENARIHSADRPHLELFTFVGRTDQKIIGSQNDFMHNVRYWLSDSKEPASADKLRGIERVLNDMPMSHLAMDSPLEALQKKTQWLTAY